MTWICGEGDKQNTEARQTGLVKNVQYARPYLLCSFKEATANASHARGSGKGDTAALNKAII